MSGQYYRGKWRYGKKHGEVSVVDTCCCVCVVMMHPCDTFSVRFVTVG